MPGAGEMLCVRAPQPQPRWQPFLFKPAAATRGLAELVKRVPGLLNPQDDEATRFHAAVSVSTLCGARSDVLAAVDEGGRVFIVGCPDESGPEPCASVVADVLAASGRLWRMSYDQFAILFHDDSGKWLEEIVMPRARSNWDFDSFKPAVERSLEQGRFPVMVVTARPTGAVKEPLSYLAGMNLQVRAVGILFEEHGGIEAAAAQPGPGPEPKPTSVSPRPPQAQPGMSYGYTQVIGAPAPAPVAPPERSSAPPSLAQPESAREPARQPAEPAGARPTEPAKHHAKPPGPGTRPGVMSGRRPPKPPESGQ